MRAAVDDVARPAGDAAPSSIRKGFAPGVVAEGPLGPVTAADLVQRLRAPFFDDSEAPRA